MHSTAARPSRWTFLTNHAHVFLCVAKDQAVRVRDLAVQVGITERAVMRILLDLEDEGYLLRTRDGRRTRYTVDGKQPMRHQLDSQRSVSELIRLVKR